MLYKNLIVAHDNEVCSHALPEIISIIKINRNSPVNLCEIERESGRDIKDRETAINQATIISGIAFRSCVE